ncbi:MAG TPA: UbiA family prenyltransferase [Gemmataceae bacterium]
MWRYILFSLRIRRIEYRVAEVPLFLIPALLTAADPSAFLTAACWEGLLIFFFLFAFGDLLNCLADRELDAVYKPHLSEAVHGVGVWGVVVQAALSAVAALALSVHLAWLLDRWLLPPAVLLGLFVAYAYSVPPLRLKGRGLWQLVFYWLGLFMGPMILTAFFFTPAPSAEVFAVAAAYGLLQTGVLLVNTAEDYPEDRQMGVRTAIVALGLRRGIGVAAVLAVVGSAGLLLAFAGVLRERGISGDGMLTLVPLAFVGALACGNLVALGSRLRSATEEIAVASVKRSARRVPAWITAVALASLLAAAVAFAQAQSNSRSSSVTFDSSSSFQHFARIWSARSLP